MKVFWPPKHAILWDLVQVPPEAEQDSISQKLKSRKFAALIVACRVGKRF